MISGFRRVSDKTEYESILSPPPWNSFPYLGPPQKYTPSLPRRLLVHFQAAPGRSKLSRSLQNLS